MTTIKGSSVRSMILSALLVICASAWAEADDVVVNESVVDAELGDIKISVTDIGEPVYEPLQLHITLLCKDHRTNRNSDGPKTISVVKPTAICAWGGHTYDQNKKVLTIKYATAAIVVGDAPCEMQPAKRFNIKKLCAPWRP